MYFCSGGKALLVENKLIQSHSCVLESQEAIDVGNQTFNELEEVRENIGSSFKSMDAFLLPPPGNDIANAQKSKDWAKLPTWSEKLDKIDEDFKKHLKVLVSILVGDEHRKEMKMNQAREQSGREFLQKVRLYFDALKVYTRYVNE